MCIPEARGPVHTPSMHVAVRPWTDDDDGAEETAGLWHCASIPFDASRTVWWNGAELPGPAVQADLGALVACAVRVARSTALPDVVLVHTGSASGRRTRLSRRPAHATTRVAYLASPDVNDDDRRGCYDWVVVYDPATADVPSSSEVLTFVAADGLVDARPPAQTRPLISVDGPCCAPRVRHGHRALAPGPPVAHALARLLLLEGPLRASLPDPPCGAPVTRVITDRQHTAPPALGWIDLASVRAPHPDLADLFAVQGDDDDDETVKWLASRGLLYASLVLGHAQSRNSYACSDLAVDLRLFVAGTQVHVPPRQAALGAYQSAVLRALEELVPGFTPPPPPADACTPRVRLASAEPAERVRAYARKVVERVRSSVY